ncbi:MAG TPA: CBS domain-containing protein [Anaerohalosphaeraceae bacterium]|nr:CBS domain-containing protein [Anaerohalosphaeraceae bacterium]HQG05586.1 CBS domain-containing protein [Anaerohalosphaeraceae bacterium]HQI07358.1 CBS domain-containing protein [Anaerohalosphaeraceae bacterium]HQJ67534.1 CBS domain-containing protein [Anaerohalosphaeraceae bacterium]
MKQTDFVHQPIMAVAEKDVVTLKKDFTVQQALDDIRSRRLGERIVYFYVVDDDGKLVGVLPTRRLLTAPLDKRLSEVMLNEVITLPHSATVLDAFEMFSVHRLLALPVVDEQGRIVGVVDIGLFTDEMFDIAKREQLQEVFELIGFRISQVREASPVRAFRFRFPWMLATISSGTICALLAGAYEVTLSKSLVLAFFLTLVLGLGESVSMQSMTVTIQTLRSMQPTLRWYITSFFREAIISLLLGIACGSSVGLIVWLWRREGLAAVSIGTSIMLSLFAACCLGLSVPTALHALKLDLKVAAGPITLALADICTVLLYFSIAALLL